MLNVAKLKDCITKQERKPICYDQTENQKPKLKDIKQKPLYDSSYLCRYEF